MISLFLLILAFLSNCLAISLDVTDDTSIRNAASTVAYGMKYYAGNISNTESTSAVLPSPYYWWESGAMWGAILDYQHNTGDPNYTQVIGQALYSQRGPNNDLMVPQHIKEEGNDDQAFWGFATMSAAEKNFPSPSSDLTWIDLTQNLWNTQANRWDVSSCGGGLRWQIFDFNRGYDYKNAVSNAAFFQLSARLARFTGNQTYTEWANKSYNWMVQLGLVDPNYRVFDGLESNNCHSINHNEWTYNNGIILYGAAVMYNHTNASSVWLDRVQGFLHAATSFFGPPELFPKVMFEPICELQSSCNTDQQSFKAYLSRFLWASTLMVPPIADEVTSLLTPSAQAAAKSCSGGSNGMTCGEKWYVEGYDGSFGVGQYMAALEIIQGLLVKKSTAPLRAIDISRLPPPVTMIRSIADGISSVTEKSDTSSPLQTTPTRNSSPKEHQVHHRPSPNQDIASSIITTSIVGASSDLASIIKADKISRVEKSSTSCIFACVSLLYTISCPFVVVIIILASIS